VRSRSGRASPRQRYSHGCEVKSSLSEGPVDPGPPGEPNERREPGSSYVCREAEDLCRDGLFSSSQSRPLGVSARKNNAPSVRPGERKVLARGHRAGRPRDARFDSGRDKARHARPANIGWGQTGLFCGRCGSGRLRPAPSPRTLSRLRPGRCARYGFYSSPPTAWSVYFPA